MTATETINILKEHSIDYKFDPATGHLEAKDEFVVQATGEHGYSWVDATDWSAIDLKDWLGY